MEPTPIVYAGIDISKATFDGCVVTGNGKPHHKAFINDRAGHAKFVRWAANLAQGSECRYCMEATGSYYEALAIHLAEAGCYVSVVNPRWTHHGAQARGVVNQTDATAAYQLAEYCRKENPPLWMRCRPEVRTLVALTRRIDAVMLLLTMEKNRAKDPATVAQPRVASSVARSMAFLEAEIADLRAQIDDHIDKHPGLKEDRKLIMSIPGFADGSAPTVIAELRVLHSIKSAKSAAAYAGLAPRIHRSGVSVNKQTRISKCGSAHLRKAVFMPAFSASRYNPAVKAIYDRLVARGRPRIVAHCAAMRKLIMIAYGVLKSRKEFEYKPTQS